MWTIYDKTGKTERCRVAELEYNGTWMGESSVTVTVESPVPVPFAIGDYLTYRGEPFRINYDPTSLKKAARNATGDAFTYEGIKLNGLTDELTRCMFLDVVPADNGIHYTSLPKFSFFAASVRDLADRLQANLDRVYQGGERWTVEVHPDFSGKENVYVDVDTLTVWDALALSVSKFDANFIVRGRTVTLGTAGIPLDNLFAHGRGKGLYEIEREADSDQQIVTRLRAYGSTRNMPERYYADTSDGQPAVPNNMAVRNLMLPGFPAETLDPCVDSANIGALGVREATVFFDGTGEEEEIYPSLEGMTAQQLADAGIAISLDAGDNGNLDELAAAQQADDDGTWADLKDGEEIPPFTATLKDIGFDINDYPGTGATLSMKDGPCGGREFEVTRCKKEGNKYVLTCNRVKDDALSLYFPNKQYNLRAGDKFVLTGIEMPDVYVKAASQRLLAAAKAYLAKNDYVRYTYSPKVDSLYMARQHDACRAEGKASLHDTLKEGDLMLFEDEDLGISGSVVIDSLTIKEGQEALPSYSVTLREDKAVGALEKIQNQLDSIAGGQGAGGYNAQQIQALIKAFGERNFLSKVRPDSTPYLVHFLAGLTAGTFTDSLLAGRGTGILPDKIQTDRLEVRGSLVALELLVNKLRGMAGDTYFADSGKVNAVEDLGDSTYKLTIDKATDADFTTLEEGDILLSVVNTLPTGGTDYYSSWTRVVARNLNDNTLTVVAYPDAEVPGGKNYPPAAGYNVVRRGNVNVNDDGTPNPRAQGWMLSSSEGSIRFLQNVTKPILEDYNYALSVGKLPGVAALEGTPLAAGDLGILAKAVVTEKVYEFDYNGDLVPKKVFRGEWSLAVAQGTSPYRYVTHETVRPSGTAYTLLEQHTVSHLGCTWGCLTDKTTDEPRWNSAAWAMLEGDPNYYLTFESTAGWQFFRGRVETDISLAVAYANTDITADLMAATGTEVEWLRDSGNAPSDNLWKPVHPDGRRDILRLTNTDMPPDWGYTVRKVSFVCRVFVPVAGQQEKTRIENRINFF